MRIQLSIGTDHASGELFDHPVAYELAMLLSLTLAFEDFNAVEKSARLAHQLTLLGVPEDDAPKSGQIGYDAPAQSLVLYYGHPGRWPGLVRTGRFTFDLDALRRLPDGLTVHFETGAPDGTDGQ